MKLVKVLFILPVFFFLFILFNTSISSCNKSTVTHDTVTVVKHDTTVVVDSIYDITSGMVAYYNFNGGSLKDSSGYGNNISFNNATVTADRFGRPGNAYLFNGSSSYMQVPNSQSLNPDNITLVAIVKLNGFNADACHGNQILQKGNTDIEDGLYFLRIADWPSPCTAPLDTTQERAEAIYGDDNPQGAGANANSDSVHIKTGTWYTLTYTYDGITAKLYINGLLKNSQPKSVAFTDNNFDLFIGTLGDPTHPFWFNGIIDEIRIYNRALPQGAVARLNKLEN